MEEMNTQKSIFEQGTYEIPLELLNSLAKEISEENELKFFDIMLNYNYLKSDEELLEVELKLINACRQNDLDLIKIFLQEEISNDSKDQFYRIDRTNKTASLYDLNQEQESITIPRTVKHENADYLITSICGITPSSFIFNTNSKIKVINFAEDSAVQTIYGNSLSNSKLEEIYFPKSLIELKEEWCYDAYFLKKINISPLNDQFVFKDDKYLLGKSDKNSDDFDVFLFVRKDLKEVSIPPNIKIIGSCSFQYSNVNRISLPASVTKIEQNAFSNCRGLTEVKIPSNSNLQIIHKLAFCGSNVNRISIPANVTKICENVFAGCDKLEIRIPENSNLISIGNDAFVNSGIKEIYIPATVTKIGQNAFSNCRNLTVAKIPLNSNLQTIENGAFSCSSIKGFSIPPSVTKIGIRVFDYCSELQIVEIPEDSKLKSIPKSAFVESPKLVIMIPKSLTCLIDAINNEVP